MIALKVEMLSEEMVCDGGLVSEMKQAWNNQHWTTTHWLTHDTPAGMHSEYKTNDNSIDITNMWGQPLYYALSSTQAVHCTLLCLT